ncbi:Ionotropic receptor 60a.1 [Diabrotica virgifera virgifera]|nr:Ionotropic receptor 60a.1 [Diabrotica virgifera virgifera]
MNNIGCTVVVIFLLTGYSSGFTCKRYSYQAIATNCIQDIIFHQFDKTRDESVTLVVIVIDNYLKSPAAEIQNNVVKTIHSVNKLLTVKITSLSSTLKSCYKGHEISYYILFLDENSQFDIIVKKLKICEMYNPRAKILLYIELDQMKKEDMVYSTLLYFFKNYFFKSIVLTYSQDYTFNLYTLNITGKPNQVCGVDPELYIIDQCSNGKMKNPLKEYFNKSIENSFSSCILNVITKPYQPFVINENEGFEIDLIKVVAVSLNIKLNITLDTASTSWGQKVNDSWVGLVKCICNDGYLGIGNIAYGLFLDGQLTFLGLNHVESLVIVVPIAQYVPRWRILTAIFTVEMWGICAGTVIFFALSFYLSGNRKHSFLTAFQIIISHAVDKFPKRNVHKIFFTGLSVLSIVLSSAYTSSILKYLKNPMKEHQVSKFAELTAYSKWGGLSDYKQFFHNKRVHDGYESLSPDIENVEYWLSRVGEDRDTWTLASETYVKYLIAIDSNVTVDKDGQPKIYSFKKPANTYMLSIMLQRGNYFNPHFKLLIRKMFRFGIIDYHWKTYKNKILRSNVKYHRPLGHPKSLALNDIQGAFALLVFGYVCALLVIALELIYKKINLHKKCCMPQKSFKMNQKVNKKSSKKNNKK